MTAIRFDPWAELAAIENAECGGAPAKVANPAKVAPAADVPAEWIVGVDRLETMPSPAVVHHEPLRRRVGLSFDHHVAVAHLPAAEADALLDAADNDGWSVSEMRAAILRRDGR